MTSESVLESIKFHFGWEDYFVFILMLGISAAIGVYFGFCGKGANTPDEYLLGGRKMKTIPIAISLIASQLSGIAVMAIPAEIYSYGFAYGLMIPGMIVVLPILLFVIVPVFYNNNISNCYEYLEMRFDKRTRQLVTLSFLLVVYLLLPIYIFIPAIAFSQVTGINIHLINVVVSAVCIFYTMLGGIKAVVWTDVVQAAIMLFSVVLVTIIGIHKVGGVGEVLNRSWEGGRMNMFDFTMDLTSRITFWNTFLGSIIIWTGHVGLNQSCVQRIVALPTLKQAQKSLVIFALGFMIIMFCNCFMGLIIYAKYHRCDPVEVGIVEKSDKIVPYFVQDIVGHLKGMPGIFISCVFSAALSTMSANLNSLAGVVYFDYIKPHIKHTEKRANLIMKCLVTITGIYCMIGGIVVEQFNSILQMVITITGITQGTVVGVFMLGMLYPRATSKAAFWSTVLTMLGLAWIIIGTQININNGGLKYDRLLARTDHCDLYNITIFDHYISALNETTPIEVDDGFSIYKISFNWYCIIGAVSVWIIGVPLSHMLTEKDSKKFNAALIAPTAQFLVPKHLRHTKVLQQDDIEMALKQ